MYVKTGWNTDFGKQKFDIGLDETDLARILTEAGIPPDAQLTATDVFVVLDAEAERFSQYSKAARTDDSAAKGRSLQAASDLAHHLSKIKARLGIE